MRNYRAFRSAKYPIRPVTIFLGANSVGKTSALQMPLLLKQTASVSGNDYSSALKVHGRDVSFGLPGNLFHNQNFAENLSIELTISDRSFHDFVTQDVRNNLISSLTNIMQYVAFSAARRKSASKIDQRIMNRLMIQSEKPNKIPSDEYRQLIDDLLSIRDSLSDGEEDLRVPLLRHSQFMFNERSFRSRQSRGTINVRSIAKSDLERTLKFLTGLSDLPDRPFEFSFGLGLTGPENNRSLRIERFSISTGASKGIKNLLSIAFAESGDVKSLSSDILPLSDTNSYNSSMSDNFVTGHDIFSFVRPYSENVRYIFPEVVRQICHSASVLLHTTFADGAIRHIGPLRAYPKRFYFLDTAQAGSAEGDSLIEALRENAALKRQVNEWLSRFGVNLNVNQFQEIIHRLAIKSDTNSFELDITDVGFGISQILPILVEGYISPPGTVILVEQPEIHLHPKMQGDLADLFISMSGARNPSNLQDHQTSEQKFLLIETHSEYLLNRLRRRIAERSVSHEDIAIVIADKISDGSTRLESVPVSEDGSFPWPSGFQEATLDDAIAYAQALASSGKH